MFSAHSILSLVQYRPLPSWLVNVFKKASELHSVISEENVKHDFDFLSIATLHLS